ncbi:uncharacterized protein [Rutidosis leptorrhynchoides]|uniref:uncharacterized protein isoform X2 n=1 Tax=Rutidosis leptorrhynchoides TaxID=125765 RepID=UPI003A994589
MGTEVHCKSSFEGCHSMRDVNEDSNSSSWSVFYGDKPLTPNVGHYYNGFIPRTVSDAYPGCDKEALKQKMLEHEATFKEQVFELHRLYRRQRDMMEEVKRNGYHKHRISIDTSSSSSLLPSQKPYEDGHKWQIPSFPLTNSSSVRPSIFGVEINTNSPLSCSKGNDNSNNYSSKDFEIMDCSRPSKVRKKLFDLELPPDENIDHEEQVEIQYKQASAESSYKDTSPGQCIRGSNGLADLNEPVNVEEAMAHGLVDGIGPSVKPCGSPFLGSVHNLSQSGRPSGAFNHLAINGKSNGRNWLSNVREQANNRSNANFTPGTYPEIQPRLQDHSRFNHTSLPFLTSRTPTSYQYTDVGNSWGKSNGCLTQTLTSFKKQPSSQQSHPVFGDKLRTNGFSTPNGIYRGSSSGLKDPYVRLPSGGNDNLHCSNFDDRSKKFFKGSNFIDLTDSTKGIDLNTDSYSAKKCDQTVPSWLQAKPAICKNDTLGNNTKISVFGSTCVAKNDSSSLASTSASLRCLESGKIKTEMEHKGFDINVAYVEACNVEKKTDTEIEKIKNHFDLNSCLTDEDDIQLPESVKGSSENTKKKNIDINLIAEEEEAVDEVIKTDDFDDELIAKVAAEAIVAMTGMSSQQDQAGSTSDVAVHSDDVGKNRLLLLVEATENARLRSTTELDEYEQLTMQLELTKEEDYMPKPLGSDFLEPEEVGPSTGPTRPRRGQARRGRPRRDFQRDILPGLVSLSRHEVTEDIQIFGGLMKATGHTWNVGLTRRNGTRGRRKSVAVSIEPPTAATPPLPPPPPPPLTEVVGLEERSLTGWGKTTRRPRRQRCAAGSSSVAVQLT